MSSRSNAKSQAYRTQSADEWGEVGHLTAETIDWARRLMLQGGWSVDYSLLM